LVFRATIASNNTPDELEAASTELYRNIFLERPIVLKFKTIPKKVVTGTTKLEARVVSEEAEEEDSREPRIRRRFRKPLKPIPRSSLCQGRGCWALP
jgi:hypothetical protein